jgi:hypothetical protein
VPRCRSGKLSGYGDWTCRRRARWCRPVAESVADMVAMGDGDAPRLDSVMMQRPRSPVLAA